MANQENSIKTIEEGIVSFSNGKVSCINKFDYKGLIYLALGLAMLCLQIVDEENGTLTMFLLIGGIGLALYGLITFLIHKPKYYFGSIPMKMRTYTFDADRYADFMKLYDAGDFSGMLDLPRSSASKMMLKILVDNDYLIAFSQVYKFTNQGYMFEPQCEIREHTPSECQKINTLVISY